MSLLIRWIVNTLALLVVANVVPHISYTSWVSLAVAAAVLGLLNLLVRPVLYFLTLPLTIVTLGLFFIVLNGIMLELTDFFVPGFQIDGFGWAIVGAIVLSLISLVTDRIGRKGEERD
jgi:putative membrane protein